MAPTFAPYNEVGGETLAQVLLGYAVTDEALMRSSLATFALHRGDLLRQGHDDNSDLRERAGAINLINSRLGNLHLAVADTTITTVAVLAANEVCSVLSYNHVTECFRKDTKSCPASQRQS